ncbi:MAG: TPR repeat-containing protein [Gammaproteobacteria bacterium]|nr:MAG: TPR repeat-containing protein [Gammaproteobacteria bacterium]TND04333.1 MAG: TPR repeat-containing protein [Gammaproteobacteria bacterium]
MRFPVHYLAALVVSAAVMWPGFSTAETHCDDWVAKAVSVEGGVDVRRAGESAWQAVEQDETFCTGDSIRVAERSRAALMLVNETVMRLDQATTVTLTAVARESESVLDLLRGAAHFISRVPRNLKITTPFVNAGVEGTEFVVRAGAAEAFVAVFEGTVVADNGSGTLRLAGGASATARSGQAPQLQTTIKPRDAVEWTLHYPAVIDFDDRGLAALPAGFAKPFMQSVADFRAGNTLAALDALNSVKPLPDDPRFFSYRASLLLSVGRVDEARADIDRAMRLRTNDADALALQSVIAIARNDIDQALQSAEQATTAAPDNAGAHLAQSYAHQAVFHLDIALEHARVAATLKPDSAVAWARLAELRLMLHDLDGALAAADKAVALDPAQARTQTVLGFAELIRLNTAGAVTAFNKAIRLDQADPLARLGLGLAQIRQGKLETGRRNMEIAAVLDPNRSLIRSYLGKAYYEERRDKLAGDQFAMAKQLDPNDPTPWLYDALRKQSDNRPVEALEDLQASVERNDNRAVYRSRLMLDEDHAARLTSQARIYSDLGFDQLALIEGWKSLNEDPANYSAHRFIAESYASRPRHEIARVSSLLQSQLLQPVNAKPATTQLAESELFILSGTGPATPSFNEYSSLYAGDGLSVLGSGVIGGNNTMGNEFILSGVKGNTAVSVSQFLYDTKGFRDNNDQEQNIYNLFVQSDLTHKTSVQAEVRSNERDAGDLEIRFDPTNFSSSLREIRDTDTSRLGLRHNFATGIDVLFSVLHQDQSIDRNDSIPGLATNINRQEDGLSTELQILYRSGLFNVVSGFRDFSSDSATTIDIDFGVPCPLPTGCRTTDLVDTEQSTLYVYSYSNLPQRVQLTAGLSAIDYENTALPDRSEIDPKLGVTWDAADHTTLRVAAFKMFKQNLVADQTLEPVQVAGFNQFFDDADATESRNYGIGVDQQISSSLNGGVEISARNLEVPKIDAALGSVVSDWEEHLSAAYLYWTPKHWISTILNYQYEKLERTTANPGTENILALETSQVKFGVSLFEQNTITLRITTTYVDQEGDFFDPAVPPAGLLSRDSDKFWILDTGFSVRLPKRYGLFLVEAKNLTNEKFKFQDTDPGNPTIYPDRTLVGKLTVNF